MTKANKFMWIFFGFNILLLSVIVLIPWKNLGSESYEFYYNYVQAFPYPNTLLNSSDPVLSKIVDRNWFSQFYGSMGLYAGNTDRILIIIPGTRDENEYWYHRKTMIEAKKKGISTLLVRTLEFPDYVPIEDNGTLISTDERLDRFFNAIATYVRECGFSSISIMSFNPLSGEYAQRLMEFTGKTDNWFHFFSPPEIIPGTWQTDSTLIIEGAIDLPIDLANFRTIISSHSKTSEILILDKAGPGLLNADQKPVEKAWRTAITTILKRTAE